MVHDAPDKPLSPFRLAASFLLPVIDTSRPDDPNWRRAGVWLLVWGILIGAAYMLLFRGAWRLFGEYRHLRLVPVAMLLVLDLGFTGRRLVLSAAELAHRSPNGEAPAATQANLQPTLLMLIVILLKFTLLLSLPMGARMWPADWRTYLGPLYPEVVYRPLLLMAFWGRWGLLLTLGIGRIHPSGSNRLRAMADGVSLIQVAGGWLLATSLTMLYLCGSVRHIGWALGAGLGVFVAVYFCGYRLARRYRGQTEMTVLASGLAGEIAFLLIYLPLASSIYWY